MDSPGGDFHVKAPPGLAKAAEGPRAIDRENVPIPDPGHFIAEDLDRLSGQGHLMPPIVLHPLSGQRPKAGFKIEFGPLHTSDLAAALAGQDQQLHDRAERIALLIRCLPYRP